AVHIEKEVPKLVHSSTLIVEGMDCADEARPIEAALNRLPGVHSVRFNLVARELIVEHTTSLHEIRQTLKKTGFDSALAGQAQHRSAQSHRQVWQKLILTLISGIFAVTGLVLDYLGLPEVITMPLFVTAILSGGFPIARKGWKEARNLTLGMNFLMAIAVIGAMAIGEASEAAMVVFLFALAQWLESRSMDRARKSIQSLMNLAPNVALLKTSDGTRRVGVEEVELSQTIIIKPGDRIPLDGDVTGGTSNVDQAPITGESIPATKAVGETVFAGTINGRGTLEVRVTKRPEDTTLARIIHLVEEAQAQKAPSQSFVEKFARYYTPAVVLLAALIATIPPLVFDGAFMDWFYRALVLLVISCPCALVISTPVTIISGLTNAARNGILIKGGAHLEGFDRINVMAFDKTGTLTVGQPQVDNIITFNRYGQNELLTIAASIESRSEHPLAQAIVDYAQGENISLQPIEEFQAITGKGVRASVNGVTYYIGNHRLFEENGLCEEDIHTQLGAIHQRNRTAVIIGDQEHLLGIISVADAHRAEAPRAIRDLKGCGIRKTVMLTGDNKQTAEAIANDIGLDSFYAELLPEDKVEVVKRLSDQYGNVAMVGDGINDAPALAAADIGISMGASATDTALETADIALMNDDLSRLSYLKHLSSKTLRIIKQNISLAILLKSIFVLLAIPGLVTLWMAVFADMGASLIVVFNGLRALRIPTNRSS
ncbi:MAG: cadmium-translocating P-type ATPase, partial [Bacteroidetes bacterium]|nr:cadmium-translocating P-type ATPase [Bacteroidota bacterium]